MIPADLLVWEKQHVTDVFFLEFLSKAVGRHGCESRQGGALLICTTVSRSRPISHPAVALNVRVGNLQSLSNETNIQDILVSIAAQQVEKQNLEILLLASNYPKLS